MTATTATTVARTADVAAFTHAFLGARHELADVLTDLAVRQSAEDEIFRSVRALSGAAWELQQYAPRRLNRLATFLPSNNVLYSYVLFGIVPSLYTDEVLIRPSARTGDTAAAVHEILRPHLARLAGRVELTGASQRAFTGECARSDLVVFTGQPDNAEAVGSALGPGTTLLAFGSGPNPIVLGPRADLDRGCRAVLEARTYNSGQDCLAPDLVFVHRSVAREAADRLGTALAELPVGDRRDPEVVVAPLVYPDAVAGAAEFLDAHREHVLRGGRVDPATGAVEPTLLRLPWQEAFHPPELFSPVLVLMEYDRAEQVEAWLNSPAELARGMYVSVFGEPGLRGERIGTSVTCHERTTFDIEDGNQPFGGYGRQANSVRRGGRIETRPLLVSAETGRR
ncbi:aldehyde dehydrogenase family protein [Kitasatospora sp. NPDC096140]|uniref:aldehyde dehydrogenase family protein n=1 Tax=Kitasatospora sp. NPDC096140 TaxID=3155425 RepID=UPI00332E2FBA